MADALLAAAFDATTIGLALIDATGRTVRVNQALGDLVGRDPEAICAAGLQQVLGEGTASAADSALLFTRPDGTTVSVRVKLAPLADAAGSTTGVLAQLEDISDRERATGREDELREELDRVRATAALQLATLRRVIHVQHAMGADEDVPQAVCDAALDIGGALCAMVFERDGTDWIRSTATAGLDGMSFDVRTDQPSGVVQAFTGGAPLWVGDAASNPAVQKLLAARIGVQSVLYQPVVQDGATIAVLTLGWRDADHQPSARVIAAAELLAADLAVGLRRSEHMAALEAATTVDADTGLLNARGWDGAVYLQVERSRRADEPLSIAIVDLPRRGDVTRHVHAWRGTLRITDTVARMEDARLAVLLPGCDLAEARSVVERMEPGAPHGIVQWDGSEGPARLTARADAALYEELARLHAGRLTDPERVASVKDLTAGGDSPLLHELAQAAATALEASAVAVSLVDDQRQTFLGQHGIEGWAEYGTELSHSFCQYPTVTDRPFVVNDSREHPLVADNPAVADLDAIAYAGIPLHDADGNVLGALCAIEPNPRMWAEADIDVLAHFADLAATELQKLRERPR